MELALIALMGIWIAALLLIPSCHGNCPYQSKNRDQQEAYRKDDED